MKLMLVDDERLALVQLERILQSAIEHLEIQSFQNVLEAVNQAGIICPDVIFLDIHMPEMSGLHAAEKLQEICPDTDIVFITAYDQYAIQAFELNAIDYLLKPVSQSRVLKTIDRINKKRLPGENQRKSAMPGAKEIIYCFKTIRFQPAGGSVSLPKWRTSKAQELFAYLLHHRGEMVLKSTLLEMLTPELDKKRAMTQLYTAIYQIRQCIHRTGMNIEIKNASIQEGYILDINEAELDVVQWERELQALEGPVASHAEQLGKLLDQYEGDYLQDHDYIWAENERERLRQLWLLSARMLGKHYVSEQKHLEALKLYEQIQERDPYNEEEGITIMDLYDKLGQNDKVASYYTQLSQLLLEELGLEVSSETSSWYERWKASRCM